MQEAPGSKAAPTLALAGSDQCFGGNLRAGLGTEQTNRQKRLRQCCQQPPANSPFRDALQASEPLPTTSLRSILSNRSSPWNQHSARNIGWPSAFATRKRGTS